VSVFGVYGEIIAPDLGLLWNYVQVINRHLGQLPLTASYCIKPASEKLARIWHATGQLLGSWPVACSCSSMFNMVDIFF